MPGYAKKARKDANLIRSGRAEEMGILADTSLASAMQNIDAISMDSAFANSPEQQQAYRDQLKRQARQDFGVNKVNQVNSLYMALRGMQAQGIEGYLNRDQQYAQMLAQANLQGRQGYYQPGWREFGLGLLQGGLGVAAAAAGRRPA